MSRKAKNLKRVCRAGVVLPFSIMEPQQKQVESVIAPLKKVTPLSKYLALLLFVILPFLGGYIGYTLVPVNVVEVRGVDVLPESSSVTPKSDDASAVEKTTQSARKIFSAISEECKNVLSEQGEYYAIYTNELSTGQRHRCDYERWNGETYDLSSTTIRVVDLAEITANTPRKILNVYENVKLSEGLLGLTQIPYLTFISSTTDILFLTSNCFVQKECRDSGLYKYSIGTNQLTEMKTSEYYDQVLRASVISLDRVKIISSDYNYQVNEPNSLYLIDLKTDTFKIIDTLYPEKGEGTFCAGGVGGCADINVDWLPGNKVSVVVFKKGSKRESRIYSLE